ncbi:MAG: S24 family peptidase [Wolinella sp.]
MFPIIPRQCFLLVQKTPQVQESEVCVARIGEEMYVKKIIKLPRVHLLSENEQYEPINITDEMDFEIIGRVVGYFGRL